jgi:hypothetical protein
MFILQNKITQCNLVRPIRLFSVLLIKLKCGWVDNIKMDHREVGWDSMDWIDLAQWRTLMNMVMNCQVP